MRVFWNVWNIRRGPANRGLFVLSVSLSIVSIRVSSYWFVSHHSAFLAIRCEFALASQRAHAAMITSVLRQSDVATSFWPDNDVIIVSYVLGCTVWLLGRNTLQYNAYRWHCSKQHVILDLTGSYGFVLVLIKPYYRKISYIRQTKSPNLNVSLLVVQLSLPNPMTPDVKSRMKMQLEQRRQAISSGASYIRDLTVVFIAS